MNIALIGYGKMGKAVEKIALEKGHLISLRISTLNQEELTKENLENTDVAIEFTGAETAVSNIRACLQAGIPVISGSTGWMDQLGEIDAFCKEINGSFLYASNFSIGVNIFFEVNRKLASLMAGHSEYDVHIEETHHTQKKDAPSGTAITLAEQILKRIKTKKQWSLDSHDPTNLSITALRIDPAPGTHQVKYHSHIDDIEIIHTAHNRDGFAAGALLAAEYILYKKGIFTMKDVLGII